MSELINNSEHRQQILKEMIRSLHEGKPVDEVKKDFSKYFENVSTTEISQIEQALVKEGLPVEEVQRLCDVHAAVFKGSIEEIHGTKDYSRVTGHPVNVLIEENKAVEKVVNEEIIPYLKRYLDHKDNTSLLMLRIGFDRLSEVNVHYSRKEYIIFPHLEKRSIATPPKVMWGVDDEIRSDIKDVIAFLSAPEINEEKLKEKIESVTHKVLEMIFKENNILIPLLSDTLTFYDWVKIDEATPEVGYCLVKPSRSWKVEEKETAEGDLEVESPEMVSFDAGGLLPEEINAVFNTLPFDLTFVDAENKVKYFTQNKDRIFQRPKTIIGVDVSMCHPPASVNIVEKMIESFKNGEKDHEDFWINKGEAFIYIRYFAVRNASGKYLGTLEVTQNINPITKLKGEKRLTSERLKATD